MRKIIITDSNAFESEIMEFENELTKIKDIFDSERKNTDKIKDDDNKIWSSETQRTIYDKKREFQENFSPIEEAIETYIKFLKKTLEDYRRFEETTNKSMEQQSNNLDVNYNV